MIFPGRPGRPAGNGSVPVVVVMSSLAPASYSKSYMIPGGRSKPPPGLACLEDLVADSVVTRPEDIPGAIGLERPTAPGIRVHLTP